MRRRRLLAIEFIEDRVLPSLFGAMAPTVAPPLAGVPAAILTLPLPYGQLMYLPANTPAAPPVGPGAMAVAMAAATAPEDLGPAPITARPIELPFIPGPMPLETPPPTDPSITPGPNPFTPLPITVNPGEPLGGTGLTFPRLPYLGPDMGVDATLPGDWNTIDNQLPTQPANPDQPPPVWGPPRIIA